MPLQNRVAPDGAIFADAARGLLMGNRGGQLHDGQKRLTARRWASKQWIACALEYKDRHETIMAPGRYTQLFFLDEATALAAGHRPCALCRRADFLRFTELWARVHGLARRPKVAEVDTVLHAERVGRDKHKVTFEARLGDLPVGVMVAKDLTTSWPGLTRPSRSQSNIPHDSSPLDGRVKPGHDVNKVANLYFSGALLPWSPSGYGAPIAADPSQTVRVLTPRSIVAVIAAGHQPMLHPSARSRSAARSV
jgi:hypothetical protein